MTTAEYDRIKQQQTALDVVHDLAHPQEFIGTQFVHDDFEALESGDLCQICQSSEAGTVQCM